VDLDAGARNPLGLRVKAAGLEPPGEHVKHRLPRCRRAVGPPRNERLSKKLLLTLPANGEEPRRNPCLLGSHTSANRGRVLLLSGRSLRHRVSPEEVVTPPEVVTVRMPPGVAPVGLLPNATLIVPEAVVITLPYGSSIEACIRHGVLFVAVVSSCSTLVCSSHENSPGSANEAGAWRRPNLETEGNEGNEDVRESRLEFMISASICMWLRARGGSTKGVGFPIPNCHERHCESPLH
jgi:hypothetical protein